MNYLNFINFDVFILGIAIASNAILAFVVFLNNRSSITNRMFLLFAILTICWSGTNFLALQFSSPTLVLWLLRLAIFFAVWHAFSFFHLFYVFPQEKVQLPVPYKFIVFPLILFTAILTLTPLVFTRIAEFSPEGQVASVTNGPAIAIFGIVVTGSILGGLFLMLKKMIKASGMPKVQLRYILIGAAITFVMLVIFNFILPAFFNNARFVPLGAVFILPFTLFTSYAIIRHHLLNVKVVATEILAFVLAITSLVEVVISHDIGTLILRLSTFVLILIFSLLLIRSVQKEVEQRENLEVLTKRLEELDRSKSEFVSIASHQLRTPLTAMKGYISMILEGSYGTSETKQKKPLESIFESNERLIRLVNDLLNVSRIESGKIEMKWEQGSVEEVIKSVVEELRIKTKEKNVDLVFEEPESSLPLIRIDKEKIRNVMLNVIDNAIRYTPQGNIIVNVKYQMSPFDFTQGALSRVERANAKTPNLLISVQDTGEGMTQEEIGKLFQTFSRGGAGMRFSTEGAGLGLYIAKKFVEMLTGRIWVESKGKGQGSTFYVELPVKQEI